MVTIIDRERERLHKIAQRWGLQHERTLQQSRKVDQLIHSFMVKPTRRK